MSPVSLDLVPPGADLEKHLSTFFEFRSSLPQFDAVERADIGQIRFMLSGNGFGTFVDGHRQDTTRVFVLGPTTGPMAVTLYGPVLVFGVSILPQGWLDVTRTDASTLIDRIVDARAVFGPRIFDVADALADAPDLATRVEIASYFLRDVIAAQDIASNAFAQIVNRWLETGFSPDIEILAQMSRLSRRQIERNCKRIYGVSPKLLVRKYRAIRAARSLARGEASMDEIVATGFYDQSHLIREIREFTGSTPGAIPGDMSDLARLTLQYFDHLDQIPVTLTEGDEAPI